MHDPATLGEPPRERLGLHIALFAGTILSTLFVGYLMSANLGRAAGYSAAIIGILLTHEMGHFFMCRAHSVRATLPYFVPFPFLPFGTLGAIIRMRGQLRSKNSIFDIGVAGPLAGLAIALPVTFWGLQHSEIITEVPGSEVGLLQLGDSILFLGIMKLALGTIPEGADVILHPVALAGWAGLFVTGLNLLPVGQLDGGHILYAMIGGRARWIGWLFTLVMLALTIFHYRGWWLWTVLLFVFMRRPHPPAMDRRPLTPGRLWLGLLAMILFLITFVPRPFVVTGP